MRFWNLQNSREKFDGIFYGTIRIKNNHLSFTPNTSSINTWNVLPTINRRWRSLNWSADYIGQDILEGNIESRGCSSIELTRVQ